mmetsp:Transcript_34834/g.98760  ORF Transcript_34834/g.98760 Transcript_34834/m.98760 type:complete len:217 (-) Transcript_34834:19-669(-)
MAHASRLPAVVTLLVLAASAQQAVWAADETAETQVPTDGPKVLAANVAFARPISSSDEDAFKANFTSILVNISSGAVEAEGVSLSSIQKEDNSFNMDLVIDFPLPGPAFATKNLLMEPSTAADYTILGYGPALFSEINVYEEAEVDQKATELVMVSAVLGTIAALLCCLCIANSVIVFWILRRMRAAAAVGNNLISKPALASAGGGEDEGVPDMER